MWNTGDPQPEEHGEKEYNSSDMTLILTIIYEYNRI